MLQNSLDPQYQQLLQEILYKGVRKEGRNGATYSIFGKTIRHDMSEGFPLLTTKKMYFKGITTELMWFLRGRSDLRYLLEYGNKIWVGDAYENYLDNIEKDNPSALVSPYTKKEFIEKILSDDEFSKKFGDLGRIYGKQWRNWTNPKISSVSLEKVIDTLIEVGNGVTDEMLHSEASRLISERDSNRPVDQIQNMIDDLKNKPDSRRIMVNAWNPAELENMVLPPCHYGFQVWTREMSYEEKEEYFKTNFKGNDMLDIPTRKISLLWNQRSVDTPLGLPFNIASYGLLLKLIADEVNMIPETLIGNLGDTHIYENQIEGVKEQLNRRWYDLPTVSVQNGISAELDDIELKNYVSEDKIKFPLSN